MLQNLPNDVYDGSGYQQYYKEIQRPSVTVRREMVKQVEETPWHKGISANCGALPFMLVYKTIGNPEYCGLVPRTHQGEEMEVSI